MGFELDTPAGLLRADGHAIPLVLVGKNGDPWFLAAGIAAYLGYAQPKVAVTKVLKGKNVKTFGELLPDIHTPSSQEETMSAYDKRQRWVNEPGLYRLIGSSTLPAAEAFQDWVYEEVLPSIRKTGAYSVKQPHQQIGATPWQQSRVDGIELCKLKNASLHALLTHLASDDGQARRLYAEVASAVNQAVLNTSLSKADLFEAKRFPMHMSVPDFLDFDGNLTRQYVERAFQGHVEQNMERLKAQSFDETLEELDGIGARMRASVASTGYYTGSMDKMATLAEAKSRKREFEKQRKSGVVMARIDIGPRAGQVVKRPNTRQTTLWG